jgi:hypothetical protein
MSQPTRSPGEPALPDRLVEELDGNDLSAGSHRVYELLTVAEDGWPHVALLSVGELLALGPAELRLALWPSSTTTANLARTGEAVLCAVIDGDAHRVRLACTSLGALRTEGGLAAFSADVRAVRRDAVSYARLTGFEMSLVKPDLVLPRWEETIRALRELDTR